MNKLGVSLQCNVLEGKANVIMSCMHLEILSDAEKIKRTKWAKFSPLISLGSPFALSLIPANGQEGLSPRFLKVFLHCSTQFVRPT